MYDFVIAGSGPSAAAALSGLSTEARILVVDGATKSETRTHKTFSDLVSKLSSKEVFGENYEYLKFLGETYPNHPKLRSPKNESTVLAGRLARVNDGEGRRVTKIKSSLARGGYSRIWGAQLYRYTQEDLNSSGSWPISVSEIETHYVWIENYITKLGFSLEPVQEVVENFQAENTKLLYKRTNGRKSSIVCAPSRVAIRYPKDAHSDSSAFSRTDFIEPHGDDVFTASSLLAPLLLQPNIEILEGQRLVGWSESPEHVTVSLCDESGAQSEIKTKKLILACGTIETTAIVLEHERKFDQPLPFLDHPPLLVPVISPETLFSKFPKQAFPVQLSISLKKRPRELAVSFYSPDGVLLSELVNDLPFDLRLSSKVLPFILPALGVLQVWQTAKDAQRNSFVLRKDGSVDIYYQMDELPQNLGLLIRGMAKAGFFTSRKLIKKPTPGWGFHYASTLPMRSKPQDFETHLDGRLWNSNRVHVVDGSVLPSLPPLNHSLTLMANARRIASEIKA